MNSPAESISRFTLRRLLHISWDFQLSLWGLSGTESSNHAYILSADINSWHKNNRSVWIISFKSLYFYIRKHHTSTHTLSSLQSNKYLSHYIKDKDVMKPNEPAVEISKKNNYCTSASTQQTSKPHLLPDSLTPSTYSSSEIEPRITKWIIYPESTVFLQTATAVPVCPTLSRQVSPSYQQPPSDREEFWVPQ